jgi:hypothetical protein
MNTARLTADARNMGACQPAGHARARRGVLLLVVLSMLALFLMLGAAFIVTATRARETARAYAKMTFGGNEARIPYARLLDGVLLDVLAGGTNAAVLITSGTFESLLADKYGLQTLSGTATSLSLSGPVITANVTLPSARPTDLVGRVLTLVEPGRPATSHRIVRATGSGATNAPTSTLTLYLDVPICTAPFTLAGGAARVIINGREFAGVAPANEGWDGYDAANNQFLAQVQSSTSSISQTFVLRGSYVDVGTSGPNAGTFVAGSTRYLFRPIVGSTATLLTAATDFNGDQIPDAADNDNDGVVDGVFLDFGIPDVTDSYGNVVRIRASVLVLPLDGRFNVNAHGSLNPILYSPTHSKWTSAPQVTGSFAEVPMGSGYGSAEIQANRGFRDEPKTAANLLSTGSSPPRLFDSGTLQPSENPRWSLTVGIRPTAQNGKRPAGSRFSVGENTPRLDGLEAKYAERSAASTVTPGNSIQLDESSFRFARPGKPDADDEASRINDRRAPTMEGAHVNYGIPSRWWSGLSDFDWGQAGTTEPPPRGVFNSPPDLHGRMKTLSLVATGSGIAPQVGFAQPEWSGTSKARETKDDPYELRVDTRRGFGGWLHDPETDGTTDGSLPDNPFTLAELEPVLRPYDIDTNRASARLAAMLGSAAEESRLKITTDSWDTTAITGSAALVMFGTSGGSSGWLQSATNSALYWTGTSGVIAGEVSRGERFDLTRALAPAVTANAGYVDTSDYVVQRQAYFQDLYTLLYALVQQSGTTTLPQAGALAQWAANVVEFRDADSRVIPFEYDENPKNGWTQDGVVTTGTPAPERGVVWGAERPEIVIQETLAWRNSNSGSSGMIITLHRPWNAKAYGDNAADVIAAEPCDYAFDSLTGTTSGRPRNAVNMGKKPFAGIYGTAYSSSNALDVSGTVYPIWRLRIITTGTQYVAFTGTSTQWIGAPSIMSGGQSPTMAVDATFTTLTGSSILTGSGVTSGTVFVSSSNSLVMPTLTLATSNSGTVYLERLSDPTIRLTTDGTAGIGPMVTGSMIWNSDPLTATGSTWPVKYLVMDSMPLQVVETVTATTSLAVSWNARGTASGSSAFWNEQTTGSATVVLSGTTVRPAPLSPGKTAWLPWANRPFVSSAELVLVPQGSQLEILKNYRRLTPAESGTTGLGYGIPISMSLLFDAVHVPTRFAGIHTTATNTKPGLTGIDTTITTVNQFSSFREPGRVNLNVVQSEDVWNAVVAGSLNAPVVTGTRARLSLTGTGDWNPVPAKSLLEMVALSGTGTTVVSDTTTTVSGSTVPMPTYVLAWDKNPLHEIYTATRLANTTTPRSNVFGVWITLQESVANDPDSVKLRRAFYIVDRSIPVGFEPGKTYNVWDCVRLRRIIE